jgi:hypothetical protein
MMTVGTYNIKQWHLPWNHFCSVSYLNFRMTVTILHKACVSARRHSALECAAPWDVSSERKEILSSSTILSYLHTSLNHHAIAFEKREKTYAIFLCTIMYQFTAIRAVHSFQILTRVGYLWRHSHWGLLDCSGSKI